MSVWPNLCHIIRATDERVFPVFTILHLIVFVGCHKHFWPGLQMNDEKDETGLWPFKLKLLS